MLMKRAAMTGNRANKSSRLHRMAASVKIVPIILAIIGGIILVYGFMSGSQTPQTFGAALIGIAIVAQVSAILREGSH